MHKWIARASAALALIALVSGAAGADTTKPKAPPKMAAATLCPVCHMPLSDKKTKTNTVAVRLKKGGKIQYCCAKCKMPASVLVKTK